MAGDGDSAGGEDSFHAPVIKACLATTNGYNRYERTIWRIYNRPLILWDNAIIMSDIQFMTVKH